MLARMAEQRGASALKGKLADVYVPALVDGAVGPLARRLGNRAIVDDPLFGRVSTLASIEPALDELAARFQGSGASYRHVASISGADRDVSEGVLSIATGTELPIAVVAERRRLREIEVRVYYATGKLPRPIAVEPRADLAVPQIVRHVLEALRKGAVERVLAGFEGASRFVDPSGGAHAKRDGAMAVFLASLGAVDLTPAGLADDGRTCCIEALVARHRRAETEPAALSFERGDSGLLRELRLYYEP